MVNGLSQRIKVCNCIDENKCVYTKCVNCGSDNIIFRNWSHVCLSCNTLQDVILLSEFIECKRHGKFKRDLAECPKCLKEFWS